MAATPEKKASDLHELAQVACTCTHCALAESRTQVVFGGGNPGARVMLIDESPGTDEDLQGRPFVGQAGQLLDKLLGDIELTREDVYITNIIKCRPPEGRNPQPEEIAACRDYLMAQIAIVEPQVICTLGRHAAITLLDMPKFKITQEHGKTIPWKGLRLLPMFHPNSSLHRPQTMVPLREDFVQLEQLLKSKITN